MKKRGPTPEDHELWETVSRDITPLKRRSKPVISRNEAPQQPSEPSAKAATRDARPVVPHYRPPQPAPPRLAPLDRRTRTRVVKGSITIDARIDLHGLTQASAHRRLHHFLYESQAAGAKLVLVITGKGRQDDTRPMGEERGVLRRSVPSWLSSAELRPFVIGFETAGRNHGGEGALYVRVRSRRKISS
jgi:DNA-nicking Smr family endonuclease